MAFPTDEELRELLMDGYATGKTVDETLEHVFDGATSDDLEHAIGVIMAMYFDTATRAQMELRRRVYQQRERMN